MSSSVLPLDASLLRTEFVPNESESIPIKAAIAAQREAIADIDFKISHLEQQISDLQTQRDSILNTLAINEAFLAPVRRLAPEILGSIFGHCLTPKPEPTKFMEVPLLLTSVSHNWRRVSQGTPRLWTQIYIESCTATAPVSSWIQNSRSLPLDITIHLPSVGTDTEALGEPAWQWNPRWDDEGSVPIPVGSLDIIEAISKQLTRIRRLRLHCSYSILRLFFPRGIERETSLLEELVVQCSNTPYFENLPPPNPFMFEGSQLDSVTLHGATLFTTSFKQMSNLRRLTLVESQPMTRLIELLRFCPAITELNAKGFNPYLLASEIDPSDLRPDPIILPNLLRLELEWRHSVAAPVCFLGSVRAPCVRSVALRNFPGNMEELHDFLTAAASTLRRLSFDGLNCGSYQFYRLMKKLTGVENLALTDCEVGGGMWEPLTPEEDDDPSRWVCPQLLTLELNGMDLGADFLEFVRRRTESSGQDRRIQIGFRYLTEISYHLYDVDEEQMQDLWDLQSQREGLSLTIITS